MDADRTRLDVTSGRPLHEFEGSPSYPYRVALSQVADELVADLAAICPWLSRRDLNAALDTCMDLDRGVPDVQGAVVEHARIRFSRGQNVPTEEQASALVAACLRHLDET